MMWFEYGAKVRMAEREIVDRGLILPNLALAQFAPLTQILSLGWAHSGWAGHGCHAWNGVVPENGSS